MPDPRPQRPILVALIGLEALVLAILALSLGIGLLTDRTSSEVGFAWAEIGLAALGAVLLGLVAAGVRAGRRWAQGGLAVTLQLIGLPFGVRLAQFGYWYAAVPALAVVVAALVLLFSLQPSSDEPADPEAQ